MKTNLKAAVKLSLILALFAVIASLGGLVLSDLYRDSDSIKAVWFVNDLITLFLAVPILLIALYYSQKGSLKARLIWIGSIWYLLYNYVFYLYGAQFNNFFLLYVLLFSLSVYALITAVTNLDLSQVERSVKERAPYRAISGFLFFFAIALGAPWVAMALGFIISGETPPFEMTIVFATDLVFLVSVLIFSAILLWKKSIWGIILAAMIMFKGLLYPMVLIIGGALAYFRTGVWDSFIPLYFILWVLCAYFYRLLMINIDQSLVFRNDDRV
jgi:hypothetical protein